MDGRTESYTDRLSNQLRSRLGTRLINLSDRSLHIYF